MKSIISAIPIVLGLAALAAADPAPDPMKEGLELYKAGKYAEAAEKLAQAEQIAPSPQTLFALAQAQRLAGDCPSAVASYKKVLEQLSDLQVARLVQENIEICEPPKPSEPVPPPVVPTAPPPKPQIITKTVVRDVDHVDTLAVALLGAGALGLGASIGWFDAASGSRDAADRAGSLAAHDDIADRAKRQQAFAIVSLVAGAGLVGGGVLRWIMHDRVTADITAGATGSGAAVSFGGRW